MFNIGDKILAKYDYVASDGVHYIEYKKRYKISKIYTSILGDILFDLEEHPQSIICFGEYYFYTKQEERKIKLEKLEKLCLM